ncbi:MAG: hypothetical protein IJU16_07340 [Clostridia bacterium]|nr:hypothetical protein [Clostridia bacterium]
MKHKKATKALSLLLGLVLMLGLLPALSSTALAAPASAAYVKVTSEPEDWSGDYLIVFEKEDESKAFDGSSDSLNASGNYIDVTISGDEIESDDSTDAAKVTITQIDGGYSIKTTNDEYIGGVSGQNKLLSSWDAIVNTISLDDDGNAKIVSNTSVLRFNSTWDGFRYYRSVSQKPVQLYKLTGGSAPTPETYTITWVDGNGDTLKTEQVAYGETPSYDCDASGIPTKDADAQYTYSFAGVWSPAIEAVTGNATYTAQFNATNRFYTITWKNEDGTVLDTTEAMYGSTPFYSAPEKEEDDLYTYAFSGWTPDVTAVTGDAAYTATFEATEKPAPEPTTYKVTWNDWDGFELGYTMVEENEVPDIPYEGLTRDEDNDYTYTFIGWTDGNGDFYANGTALPAVTGDITYTATFEAVAKPAPEPEIKNGPNTNGCFYINDVMQKAYQLVEFEGDWYFIAENHKYVKNQTRYLSDAVVENTPFTAGYYEFDENGKMIVKDGVIENDFYYVNGVKQKAYLLFQIGGDYYFVAENHKIAKNQRRFLSAAVVEGTPLAADYYDFDENGKMVIKNGIVDDYYYVNGVKQKAYRLVEIDGDYYFVAESHKIAKNQRRYLNAAVLEGTGFTAGYYNFDADGRMILA